MATALSPQDNPHERPSAARPMSVTAEAVDAFGQLERLRVAPGLLRRFRVAVIAWQLDELLGRR